MLTLGELCLSPIGTATMTLLAPERMRGQMMGLWFCASALGNLAAGLIGGHVKLTSWICCRISSRVVRLRC